ncbi:MAG TPA: extensin family protein [Pseudolabrys sp.]|nr:extensin family protein [Pseudolabrys sp.]
MTRGLHFYAAGSFVLLALAGCGRSYMLSGERESWRHEAEVTCLKSGGVKIGAGAVQISPIEGPGMCGADFPLKVTALGESPAIGYSDDPRPPGGIPNGSQMPNWPIAEPRAVPPPAETRPLQAPPSAQYQPAPVQGERMRWVPGPQGIERQAAPGEPLSLSPPENARTYNAAPPSMSRAPSYAPPPAASRPQTADDIPDDAIVPQRQASYPQTQPAYRAPAYEPAQRAAPPLGPMRGPAVTATMTPAVVTPAATLACPIVSALDRWVSEGVQPAAMRWFGAPVAEIKQISAYSCRNMVGESSAHMSEHAYGNALDIAAFRLADGRRITVKDGWHGSPEEQGFLHDVQLAACEMFTTVLAPGYNVYHYDHIHVDLMRRASGRHPCRPNAVPGEVAAAKARSLYASKQRAPSYTGSIATQAASGAPVAVPGADGDFADEGSDATVTGSISPRPSASHVVVAPGADGDFDDDVEVVRPVRRPSSGAAANGDAAIRAQEQRDAVH